MKYWFYLLFAAASWGLNFHLAKVMLQDSSALEAGLWRYVLGVGGLLFLLWYDWPKWSLVKQQLWPLFLVGFVGLFGFNYCFFVGMSKTSAINAALIAGLTPAFTLIFSRILLKTNITKAQITGILLALMGVIFLILKGKLLSILSLRLNEGDAWILLANLVFALHHVWVKQYGGVLSNRHFTFLTNLFCLMGFLLFLPFYDLGSTLHYPPSYWISAVGMGIIGTSVAYIFWNRGVAHFGAAQAGIFLNMVPFSAAIFAIFFGESIRLYHIISGICIVAGVMIMQLWGKRATALKKEEV